MPPAGRIPLLQDAGTRGWRPVILAWLRPSLSALGESAEMAVLAAFLEADGLAAFGAAGADQAVGRVALAVAARVALFQYAGDGVGDGEHQAAVLEDGMFAADALELVDDLLDVDPGAQGQGDQAADGFGLGGGRAA